ncbi:hypothetical protein DRQ07_02940 [candidate division KSB1 bacterium]|nr:MAG: hypothetical protein DRQ07_02940 [candidate division KSB1 bacterium]
MKKVLNIFSVLALSLLIFGSAGAAKKVKTFDKEVKFASGGKVFVKNINGGIKVNSWDKNSVLIHADITVKGKSFRSVDAMLERVNIIVDKSDGQLKVRADYPERHNGLLDWIFGTRVEVTVSFDITVPGECDISANTVNGGLSVTGLKGEISIESTNGGVIGEDLKGSLYANTVNGSIEVYVSPYKENGDVQLESVNGRIRLTLPEDVKASVKASTVNGSIKSDFADIDIRGKYASKKASGLINGGNGSHIKISTVNGGISINKE